MMNYRKVAMAQVEAGRDRVLLILMEAGMTKVNYSFDEAYSVLLKKSDKGLLCKALIKYQRFIYNNLSEV
jgi:hypothetical protein